MVKASIGRKGLKKVDKGKENEVMLVMVSIAMARDGVWKSSPF